MSRARGKLYSEDDYDDDDDYYDDDGYSQYKKQQTASASKGGKGAPQTALQSPAGKLMSPSSAAAAATNKTPAGKGAASNSTPARPTQPAPVAVKEEEDEFPDADLLDASYDDVAAVVGEEEYSEADIVASLRACNYDPQAAVSWLLDGGRAPAKKAPTSVKTTAATPLKAGSNTNSNSSAATTPAATNRTSGTANAPTPGKAAPSTPARGVATAATGKAAAGTATPSASVSTPSHHHASSAGVACSSAAGPQALPPLPAEVTSILTSSSSKPRVSIVTCGHVDAGKSTLMGHLLYELG